MWILSAVMVAGTSWIVVRRLRSPTGDTPRQVRRATGADADALRLNHGRDAPTQSVSAGTAKTSGVISGAAEFSKGSERPRRPTYAEQAAVAEDPEFREFVTRRTEKDYAALFAKLRLPAEKEEALSMILIDWFFAPRISERAEYDRMTEELLGPVAYGEFTAYRDELAIKDYTQAALRVVAPERPTGAASGVEELVEAVVRGAPRNDDPIWIDAGHRIDQGSTLSETEIAAFATTAAQKFEAVLAKEGANLTETERNRMRDWFQQTIVQFNVRALRNAQPPSG